MSSMLTFRSGKDCKLVWCASFAPARPGGSPGTVAWLVKSGAKRASSASRSLRSHASSIRRTTSLFCSLIQEPPCRGRAARLVPRSLDEQRDKGVIHLGGELAVLLLGHPEVRVGGRRVTLPT